MKIILALIALVGLCIPAEAGCRACGQQQAVFSSQVSVQTGVFAVAVPTVAIQTVAVQQQAVAVQQVQQVQTVQTFAVSQPVFTTFAVQPVASFAVFTPVQAVAVQSAAVNVNVKVVNQRRGLFGRLFH